jgi:hypothetical protein
MNGSKITSLVLLAAGICAGAILLRSSRHPAAVHPPIQASAQANTAPASAALRETVSRLQTEHDRLAKALALARAANVRSENGKKQAEHAAQLYKELASQAGEQIQSLSQTYPTKRHLFAGFGRQSRLMAELQAKWGNVDENKLPPNEQQDLKQAEALVVSETLSLKLAAEQFKADTNAVEPVTPQAASDNVACYLYGALNLDAAQFSTVSSILQRCYDQAAQENLFQANPGDPEADANRAAALDQLNDRARMEIQNVLSSQQLELGDNSTLKKLGIVTPLFSPPGGMGFK